MQQLFFSKIPQTSSSSYSKASLSLSGTGAMLHYIYIHCQIHMQIKNKELGLWISMENCIAICSREKIERHSCIIEDEEASQEEDFFDYFRYSPKRSATRINYLYQIPRNTNPDILQWGHKSGHFRTKGHTSAQGDTHLHKGTHICTKGHTSAHLLIKKVFFNKNFLFMNGIS